MVGITRSALGNDERSVEFLERLTQLGNQVVENNRGNKRNRNAEELYLHFPAPSMAAASYKSSGDTL